MQADAFSGYNALYEKGRELTPVVEATCWAHGRRDFFDFAKLAKAPIAVEIVRRIKRVVRHRARDQRRAGRGAREVRQERSKPLVAALEAYMREQFARLSPKNDLAKAIHYVLTRWASFTRFLDDGRICLSNNAAERALRCVAVGRRNWTFAGSDAGGQRAAAVYSMIETCKLNDVDPRAWLADVLARLPDHPARRVGDLMPWAWKARQEATASATTAVAA
jgi:transposase